MSLVRLRRDLPVAECLDQWFGAHADIVRRLPDVLEYTVDVARDAPTDGSWDAVATLRFPDEASMQRSLGEPAVADALARTREGFAEAVEVFVVDEHVLIRRGRRE